LIKVRFEKLVSNVANEAELEHG